jgi:hypothetical protein
MEGCEGRRAQTARWMNCCQAFVAGAACCAPTVRSDPVRQLCRGGIAVPPGSSVKGRQSGDWRSRGHSPRGLIGFRG